VVARELTLVLVGPEGGAAPYQFSNEDLEFIGDMSTVIEEALAHIAWYEATRTVMEQACFLIERRVAGGAAWGLLVEDQDHLLMYCGTDEARQRFMRKRIHRSDLPELFRVLDEDSSVHISGVWFDEVLAAGPGRLGGGLTRSDVLMLPLRVGGRIVAILGVDLYGAAEKVGTSKALVAPKNHFTPENVLVAEELAQMAGPCIVNLVEMNAQRDWSTSYLEVVLKTMRTRLVEERPNGVDEVRRAIRVPRKATIVIIDAVFKIIHFKHPEYETISWTAKREIFLKGNMWDRMIRFHPERWRGNYDKLLEVAKGLFQLGPDEVLETCSPAFQEVYAWLDVAVVMSNQRFGLKEQLQPFEGAVDDDAEDRLAQIDSMELPGYDSELYVDEEEEGTEALQNRAESKQEEKTDLKKRQGALAQALADL